MPVLEIDGVGKVDVDNAFLSMTPEQQAQEVDAIASQLKGTAPSAPQASVPSARTDPNGGVTDEQVAMAQFEQNNPKPDELAARGSVLPFGRDKEGNLTLAVPQFLEGPRKTIMDLIEGRRTADQISGKEMFELGSLFGGSAAGGPAGTGAGIARAAARREATAAAPETVPVATAEQAAIPETAAVIDDAMKAAPEPAPVIEPPPATTAEMKSAAQSFYKKAEDAGVVLSPKSTRPLANDIVEAVADAGIDPTLHPRATAALKRIDELADQPISFKTLEILRRVANAAGKGQDKDEGRISGVILDKIDDYVNGLSAKDVISGDVKVAAETIVKARDLWSKVAKLDHIDNLVERARISAPNFSGSGMENALRTEFRALAKNQRSMRTFTPDEQKAIKKIATGTAASNAARAAGKFAPTGVVSTVLSGGAGLASGIPGGAIALPAGGFIARQIATKLTERYIKQLETLIRNGGESEMAKQSISRAQNTLKLLNGPRAAASAESLSAPQDQKRLPSR